MKIYIVGAGTGARSVMTAEARDAVNKSDALIAAKRIAADFSDMNKPVIVSYDPDEIRAFIEKNPQIGTVSVLLSGDTGFYSGAKRLKSALEGFDVEIIAGISSVSYLCAKTGHSWDDAHIMSLHGRGGNIIGYIRENKKVISLLGGEEDLRLLCEKLVYYKMGDVKITVGQRLSYPDERIETHRADEFTDFSIGKFAVIMAENPHPRNMSLSYIPDSRFIRAAVPMTKSEIRTISTARLGLKRNSTVYDIGAGTGSVSVEIALKSCDISVYAVEKNPEAVALIEQNKRAFAADNINVVCGEAPEALEKLPAPDCVFIGGASGKMRSVLDCVWEKNPSAVIVMNVISINSIAELGKILENDGGISADITQISSAKFKNAGKYMLPQANNPVYICRLERARE